MEVITQVKRIIHGFHLPDWLLHPSGQNYSEPDNYDLRDREYGSVLNQAIRDSEQSKDN